MLCELRGILWDRVLTAVGKAACVWFQPVSNDSSQTCLHLKHWLITEIGTHKTLMPVQWAEIPVLLVKSGRMHAICLSWIDMMIQTHSLSLDNEGVPTRKCRRSCRKTGLLWLLCTSQFVLPVMTVGSQLSTRLTGWKLSTEDLGFMRYAFIYAKCWVFTLSLMVITSTICSNLRKMGSSLILWRQWGEASLPGWAEFKTFIELWIAVKYYFPAAESK